MFSSAGITLPDTPSISDSRGSLFRLFAVLAPLAAHMSSRSQTEHQIKPGQYPTNGALNDSRSHASAFFCSSWSYPIWRRHRRSAGVGLFVGVNWLNLSSVLDVFRGGLPPFSAFPLVNACTSHDVIIAPRVGRLPTAWGFFKVHKWPGRAEARL